MGSSSVPEGDLVYKLSKKVAQLTKVVYQLNCKNEDFETVLRSACEAYEREVQSVLTDGRRKIGKMQSLVNTVKTERHDVEMTLKEERDLHAREKAQVGQSIATLQEQLLKVQERYDLSINSAALKVETLTTKFSKSLAEVNANHARKLEAVSENSDAVWRERVTVHEAELRRMSAQQQEERSEFEAELEAAKKKAQNEIKNLLSDFLTKTECLEETARESIKYLENSERKIFQLQQELSSAKLEHAENLKRAVELSQGKDVLSAELRQRDVEIEKLEVKLHTGENLLKEHIKIISEKTNELITLEDQLKSARDEITNLSADKNALQLAGKESVSKLHDELVRLQEERREITEELQIAEEALREATSQNRRLNEQLAALSSNYNSKMQEAEAAHQRALASAVDQAAKTGSAARESHIAELERLRKELSSEAVAQLELLRTNHLAESEKEKKYYETTLSDVKESYEKQLTTLREQLKTVGSDGSRALQCAQNEIARLNAATVVMQAHFQRELDNCRDTLDGMRSALAREEECTDSLKKELACVKGELADKDAAARAAEISGDSRVAALTAEIAAVRREAEKSLSDVLECHEHATEKLRQKYEADIEEIGLQGRALLGQHQKELERLRGDHAKESESLAARIRAECTRELDVMRANSCAGERAWKDQISMLQLRIRALEQDGEEARATLLKERLRLEDAARVTAEQHEKALAKAKEAAGCAQQQAVDKEIARRQMEVAELEGKLRAEASAHQAALDVAQREGHEALRKAQEMSAALLSAMEKQRADEKRSELDALQKKLSAEISLLRESLEKERKRQEEECARLSLQLRDTLQRLHEEETSLQQISNARSEVAAELERTKKTLALRELEHQNKVEAVVQAADRRLKSELDMQAARFTVEQKMFEERERALRRTVADWEHKYNFRESRQEDVDRINTLIGDLAQSEEALRKAYEKMKYYKLELCNREENYNKIFKSCPKIAPTPVFSAAGTRPSSSRRASGAVQATQRQDSLPYIADLNRRSRTNGFD